ncbi:unnamed protein product [Sphagnum balticum]
MFSVVMIVKGHYNQVQILQGAIGTNTDSNVKVRHRSMRGAISSKREQPHMRRAQDVWNALKINGNTHANILANNVIVEAHQLCIPKRLFVLINNNIHLTK